MKTLVAIGFVLCISQEAWAQQAHVNLDWNPHKNVQNLAPYGANLISPEVRDDRTVTFRLKAADVRTVALTGGPILLAVGILLPLAALDHRIADAVFWATGTDPGLILTGSAVAIVLAYSVRFFAIAVGATDAALGRIPPSFNMAARSLGQGAGGTLRRITLPLIRGTVGTALLLVFVDAVKELPATLLLRPFNYDTLATRVHEKASLEQIGQAAPAAVLVIAVGLAAVAVLARANR
jgi:iron(III) transport system permease protein